MTSVHCPITHYVLAAMETINALQYVWLKIIIDCFKYVNNKKNFFAKWLDYQILVNRPIHFIHHINPICSHVILLA